MKGYGQEEKREKEKIRLGTIRKDRKERDEKKKKERYIIRKK